MLTEVTDAARTQLSRWAMASDGGCHEPDRIRRLERIEGQLAQREDQAELEDLKQLAHDARAKIEAALAMYRRGEPLPEPAIRHDSLHISGYKRGLMRYAIGSKRTELSGIACHDRSR